MLRDFGAAQRDDIRDAFMPTAEKIVGSARIIVESLAPRPGIREQNRDPKGVAPVGEYYK